MSLVGLFVTVALIQCAKSFDFNCNMMGWDDELICFLIKRRVKHIPLKTSFDKRIENYRIRGEIDPDGEPDLDHSLFNHPNVPRERRSAPSTTPNVNRGLLKHSNVPRERRNVVPSVPTVTRTVLSDMFGSLAGAYRSVWQAIPAVATTNTTHKKPTTRRRVARPTTSVVLNTTIPTSGPPVADTNGSTRQNASTTTASTNTSASVGLGSVDPKANVSAVEAVGTAGGNQSVNSNSRAHPETAKEAASPAPTENQLGVEKPMHRRVNATAEGTDSQSGHVEATGEVPATPTSNDYYVKSRRENANALDVDAEGTYNRSGHVEDTGTGPTAATSNVEYVKSRRKNATALGVDAEGTDSRSGHVEDTGTGPTTPMSNDDYVKSLDAMLTAILFKGGSNAPHTLSTTKELALHQLKGLVVLYAMQTMSEDGKLYEFINYLPIIFSNKTPEKMLFGMTFGDVTLTDTVTAINAFDTNTDTKSIAAVLTELQKMDERATVSGDNIVTLCFAKYAASVKSLLVELASVPQQLPPRDTTSMTVWIACGVALSVLLILIVSVPLCCRYSRRQKGYYNTLQLKQVPTNSV